MFEHVRKHNKILMVVLFLLIIPSFVLVGVDGYNRMIEKDRTVARVGKVEITNGEWEAAHREEVERVRQLMPTIDAKLLDSESVRYATLERLVRERVLQQAAQDARLGASDVRLARELQSIPAIAQLRRADGSLDMERYRDLLGRQGMSPEMFEARMRADLAARQVQAGVAQTAFIAGVPADLALGAWFERREVQLARFATADYAARVQPTDAELEAFYQANQSLFQAPEQARIEYIVLDIDAVRKTVRLNEADVRSYYEQNAARLSGPEERRASHILISVAKDAPADERQQARAKAEELLAQARKAPESFAQLAKKHSQDPGSAPNGGDLDYFGRGAMVKPFEDAAFALKKGEISGVVESDFGFHIIRVTDIKAPKTKSFAELRASLEEDLKNQQARAKYAEAAEIFTNGVYEQSDSLKPVADKLGLTIQTASALQREPAPGARGVLASAKLLEAVFSPDAVSNKRNTEAVEIAPSQLAAARIVEHAPARTLPLTEVRATVRERVVQARAAELARQEGQQKLAAWKAEPASARLSAPQVLSRDQLQNLPQAVLDAVLRADSAQLPQWVGVDLGPQGYAVARVNKRVERPTSAADAQRQERAQYAQWWMQAEGQAYYRLLQDRLEVQIKVPRPAGAGS
ncbi:MAG: SurA N-terminal domain-containing protein [Hylemonella sp.]|uniref:SurA N-terminal domain-containing protein n=1 Tax=Hylemonella sp. TaxID=2066020 RepID=UPI0022C00328|nr:SurA N-terminal domain-containing protein [Hylemonella sp.]MCZ8251809.1 SurA N-terminal domain-containing protein [Hylemonella sp.]